MWPVQYNVVVAFNALIRAEAQSFSKCDGTLEPVLHSEMLQHWYFRIECFLVFVWITQTMFTNQHTGGAWRYSVSPDKHLESFMWTKLILMKEITTSDENFQRATKTMLRSLSFISRLLEINLDFRHKTDEKHISYLLWTKRTLINFIPIYIIEKNCMVTGRMHGLHIC